MSELQGKGMYIWRLSTTEGGNMQEAVRVAKAAGMTHVLIKIADGQYDFNLRPYTVGSARYYADDILKPAVQAFQGAGIKVWGWQYVYLFAPEREAAKAKARSQWLELDGFVADVEGECKNRPAQTAAYLAGLKGIGMPTALSSYRWPSLHREIAWDQWVRALDVMMPQVYWMGATNAGAQLERSLREHEALLKQYGVAGKPFIPTGAAFAQGGWNPTSAQIVEFLQTARKLNLPAANFWEWDPARRWAGWWDAIAAFPWPSPGAHPPETVSVERFVKEHVYPEMKNRWGYNGPAPV